MSMTFRYLLLALALAACKANPPHTAVRVPDEGTVMLVGTASLDSLKVTPFAQWYGANREAYEPNADMVAELKPLLKDVHIVLLLGTWCKDSRREVPRFVKIVEEAGYNPDDVEVIAVDRNKTTPGQFEDGLELIQVPTFIFYRNGEEAGRIVEFPIEELETDMQKILSGHPYRHAYDWD